MSRMKKTENNRRPGKSGQLSKVLKRGIGLLMTGILISIQPVSLLAETQDRVVRKSPAGFITISTLRAAYDPNWQDQEKNKDSSKKNSGKDSKQSQSVTLPPYTPSYRQPLYNLN